MCDCYDGIISDDQHGPIFCEKCPTGLRLGIADCERIAEQLAEAKRGYDPPETSKWCAEMHEQCQDAIDRLRRKIQELQTLYDTMQPDPILAWQQRPAQVREAVAALAVMRETV